MACASMRPLWWWGWIALIPRDATSEEALEASFLRDCFGIPGELKKTGDAEEEMARLDHSLVRVYHISLWWNQLHVN